MNYYEEFKNIIKTRVKDGEKITMESNLKDLGLDSLDLLEIVTDAEEKFGIRFEDDDLVSFKTVGDVINCAEGKK